MLLARSGASRAHTACSRLLASWHVQRCHPHALACCSQRQCQLPRPASCARLYCVKPGQSPEDVAKRIDKDDVDVSFARSGGAGGQNVNKVNTKVDMRFKLEAASWMEPEVREALEQREKSRINKEGEFVVTSQKTRSQADNVEDALTKMQKAIDSAAKSVIPLAPNVAKKKRIDKTLKKANEARLDNKKQASQKKSDRRSKIDY